MSQRLAAAAAAEAGTGQIPEQEPGIEISEVAQRLGIAAVERNSSQRQAAAPDDHEPSELQRADAGPLDLLGPATTRVVAVEGWHQTSQNP